MGLLDLQAEIILSNHKSPYKAGTTKGLEMHHLGARERKMSSWLETEVED